MGQPVLKITKKDFVVKLHKDLLEVDLRRGARKNLESLVERRPALRDSLGFFFQSAIPLDVPLKHIESVKVGKKGEVRITIPLRRDLVIPLGAKQAGGFAARLNDFVREEKAKEAERILVEERAAREVASPEETRAQASLLVRGRSSWHPAKDEEGPLPTD